MLKETVNSIIEHTDGKLLGGDLKKYGDKVITGVVYDSRNTSETSLFVPLVGEKVDAHRFISDVLSGDCVVSLTQEDIEYDGDKILIKVDDTLSALQLLAGKLRERISIPVVGITGSVGKTTTRGMIATALSAGRKVFSTKGNRNSQLGLSVTVTECDDDADIAVLEMGVSIPGEMSKLAAIARPNTAVITNIGVTHIENFGSSDNILKEKSHITDYMKPGDTVFINYDNPVLKTAVFNEGLKVVRASMTEETEIHAKNITSNENGFPKFTAVVFGKETAVNLKVMGDFEIMNALLALGVADLYGVDIQAAAKKLAEFSNEKHRNEIINAGGITFIDDSYNAAPDSVKAAVDVLSRMPGCGRKILVLADMKELGDISEQAHRMIGEYIKAAEGIAFTCTYGELAGYIGESAGESEDHHFSDADKLTEFLDSRLTEGDVVLFKGSNSMKLFDVAEKLISKRK